MNRKQKSLISVLSIFSIIAVIAIVYYSSNFVESTINEGFPIPLDAELIKKDQIQRLEEYTWGQASEENGLPIYYEVIIDQWRWERTSREGGTTLYERQGERIKVITREGYLFISAEN